MPTEPSKLELAAEEIKPQDLIHFKYKGGGYYRDERVPEGELAQMIHGQELLNLCNPIIQERNTLKQRVAELEGALSAAWRVENYIYLSWALSGGINECEHGYSEGIPCERCDRTAIKSALHGGKEGCK